MLKNVYWLTLIFAVFAGAVNAQSNPKADKLSKRPEIDNPQLALDVLQTELVRRELDLTEHQGKDLLALQIALKQAIEDWGNKAAKLPAEKQNWATLDSIVAPARRQLKAICTARQWARLQEIMAQLLGPKLFESTEVVGILQLSPQQARDVSRILERQQKALAALVKEMGLDVPQVVSQEFRAKNKKFEEREFRIDGEATDRITALLTPEQRNEFRRIKGAPVNVATLKEQLILGEGSIFNADP